jgi:hypothetical protein
MTNLPVIKISIDQLVWTVDVVSSQNSMSALENLYDVRLLFHSHGFPSDLRNLTLELLFRYPRKTRASLTRNITRKRVFAFPVPMVNGRMMMGISVKVRPTFSFFFFFFCYFMSFRRTLC